MDRFQALETLRLRLRKFVLADADAIYSYASDPESTRYMGWPSHASVEETKDVITMFNAGYAAGIDYAIALERKSDGRMIGSVGLHNIGEKAAMGWILHPEARGQGYAEEAMLPLIDWSWKAYPQIRAMEVSIHPANHASLKLARKLGFRPRGEAMVSMPQLGPEPTLVLLMEIQRPGCEGAC